MYVLVDMEWISNQHGILTFGKLTNCCFCMQFISYTPFPAK